MPSGGCSGRDASTVVASGLGWAAWVALTAVRAYQVLFSPLFAGSCRFTPSCSQYTAEAVRRYGAVRGGWLGIRRLGRCHPFGGRGVDPVPDGWAAGGKGGG
jgi:hypothetical protein